MRQIENLAQKQRTQRVWDTYGTEITAFPEHWPYKEFIRKYNISKKQMIDW